MCDRREIVVCSLFQSYITQLRDDDDYTNNTLSEDRMDTFVDCKHQLDSSFFFTNPVDPLKITVMGSYFDPITSTKLNHLNELICTQVKTGDYLLKYRRFDCTTGEIQQCSKYVDLIFNLNTDCRRVMNTIRRDCVFIANKTRVYCRREFYVISCLIKHLQQVECLLLNLKNSAFSLSYTYTKERLFILYEPSDFSKTVAQELKTYNVLSREDGLNKKHNTQHFTLFVLVKPSLKKLEVFYNLIIPFTPERLLYNLNVD